MDPNNNQNNPSNPLGGPNAVGDTTPPFTNAQPTPGMSDNQDPALSSTLPADNNSPLTTPVSNNPSGLGETQELSPQSEDISSPPTDPISALGSFSGPNPIGDNSNLPSSNSMENTNGGGAFPSASDFGGNSSLPTDTSNLGGGENLVDSSGLAMGGGLGSASSEPANTQINPGNFSANGLDSSANNISQPPSFANNTEPSSPLGNPSISQPSIPQGVGEMQPELGSSLPTSNFGTSDTSPAGDTNTQEGFGTSIPGIQSNPTPTDAAPTDLSHLIDPSQSSPAPMPPSAAQTNPAVVSQTENLIVPTPQQGVETPTTNGSSGFPKWLFAVGAVLLLLVAGSSAYFILGIGKAKVPSASQTSQQPLTTPSKPLTIVTPTPMDTNSASSSATFGSVVGSPSPTEASSSSGTSALDILRNRNSSSQSATSP